MALDYTHSKGIELQKGDGSSPESFTKIGGITDMPAINSEKSTIEVTSISDDNRHYDYGIGEPPSFTLTMYWNDDDDQQAALITEHQEETESNYRIVCPDSPSTEYEFKAIVTSYSTPYGGINDMLQQDFTFQLNENDHGEIVTKNPS